ncbi:MAG TPA: DNA repair protein RecO [Thermoanaerobaculia bacterium]|nr:DNA repair protein RecO [Thermoanaerobaculia bacterium]
MGVQSDEALLLEVRDLHDADRVVSFLTRERGKKRGVARSARRKHSRFAGQLQPLAKARITWFEKEGRDLVRISSIELLRSAHRLQADLDGILLTAYLADHTAEFAQEDEPGEHLYRLLDSTLEALLAGADRDLAARYFEAWALRLQGIFPPPRLCPICGRDFAEAGAVLPAEGEGLLCAECGGRGRGALRVSPEALDFLRRTARQGLTEMARRPPPPAALRAAEELTGHVRRRFLHRELRSYEVMKRIEART